MALGTKFLDMKRTQGHLEWRLHKPKQLSVIVWIDKESLFIMSTIALQIDRANE